MSDPAPGWYADPANPRQNRYWDGAAWTENVSPGFPNPGEAPPVPGPKRSLRWVWILLGVLAAVFVLMGGCAAVGFVALRGAVEQAGTAVSESMNGIDAAMLPDGQYRMESISAYFGAAGECQFTGPVVDVVGANMGVVTVAGAGAVCADGFDAVALAFTVTGMDVTVTTVETGR